MICRTVRWTQIGAVGLVLAAGLPACQTPEEKKAKIKEQAAEDVTQVREEFAKEEAQAKEDIIKIRTNELANLARINKQQAEDKKTEYVKSADQNLDDMKKRMRDVNREVRQEETQAQKDAMAASMATARADIASAEAFVKESRDANLGAFITMKEDVDAALASAEASVRRSEALAEQAAAH